jgi:hypothetical protein
MDKNKFIDYLNKITKETNSPLFYHRTTFSNLESILRDGAILPLESRKEKNYYFGGSVPYVLLLDEQIKEYEKSTFLAFKAPNSDVSPEEFYHNYNEDSMVYFLINPYDMNEKTFKGSFFCDRWNYGLFEKKHCEKWDYTKDITFNLKKWENSSKIIDEIVIKHSKGIYFEDILKNNPNGIIVVVEDKENEKIRDLRDKYSDFVWIILK